LAAERLRFGYQAGHAPGYAAAARKGRLK
jgi:hypothetical protein